MSIWKDVGLIGRKKELNKILPDLLSPRSHVLIEGPEPGIGRTAVLEWCHKHLTEKGRKCCFITAGTQNAIVFSQMCKDFGIETDKKLTGKDLEEIILKETGNVIFVDDIQKARSDRISLLKALGERHKLVMTLKKIGKNEDLRRMLWGVRKHKLKRLDHVSCLELAKSAVLCAGSRLDPDEVAKNAFGIAGRIEAMISKDSIIRDDYRTSSEEIDLAPWVIGGLSFLVVFRLIGRSMGATDLTMLGGFIMLLVRFAVYPLIRAGKRR